MGSLSPTRRSLPSRIRSCSRSVRLRQACRKTRSASLLERGPSLRLVGLQVAAAIAGGRTYAAKFVSSRLRVRETSQRPGRVVSEPQSRVSLTLELGLSADDDDDDDLTASPVPLSRSCQSRRDSASGRSRTKWVRTRQTRHPRGLLPWTLLRRTAAARALRPEFERGRGSSRPILRAIREGVRRASLLCTRRIASSRTSMISVAQRRYVQTTDRPAASAVRVRFGVHPRRHPGQRETHTERDNASAIRPQQQCVRLLSECPNPAQSCRTC
ncbi:hypothetical protein BV20DRAFT_125964 [Pilatotrama ljubarskyi]|nr:hypothetical protein BV20DRAFT_125964 [Pilatotrama ljubarskyi]